jgi:acyl carrier protein
MSETDKRIRAILAQHARLAKDAATLGDDADLYQAGMSSHASVNVMLALEGAFDIEFPDHMLTRSVFSSVSAIRSAVDELTASA